MRETCAAQPKVLAMAGVLAGALALPDNQVLLAMVVIIGRGYYVALEMSSAILSAPAFFASTVSLASYQSRNQDYSP